MPVAFDFRQQILGEWPQSRGFLVEQLDRLYANLAILSPLVDALGTEIASSVSFGTGYTVSSMLSTNTLGVPAFASTLPMPLAFVTTATISPAALTVNTNDYAPSGLSTAAVLRVSSTGSVNLTGLLAPTTTTSVMRLLVNIGSQQISLTNADTNSSASNRFRTASGVTVALTGGRAVWLWYDTTSAVWQVVE